MKKKIIITALLAFVEMAGQGESKEKSSVSENPCINN